MKNIKLTALIIAAIACTPFAALADDMTPAAPAVATAPGNTGGESGMKQDMMQKHEEMKQKHEEMRKEREELRKKREEMRKDRKEMREMHKDTKQDKSVTPAPAAAPAAPQQ